MTTAASTTGSFTQSTLASTASTKDVRPTFEAATSTPQPVVNVTFAVDLQEIGAPPGSTDQQLLAAVCETMFESLCTLSSSTNVSSDDCSQASTIELAGGASLTLWQRTQVVAEVPLVNEARTVSCNSSSLLPNTTALLQRANASQLCSPDVVVSTCASDCGITDVSVVVDTTSSTVSESVASSNSSTNCTLPANTSAWMYVDQIGEGMLSVGKLIETLGAVAVQAQLSNDRDGWPDLGSFTVGMPMVENVSVEVMIELTAPANTFLDSIPHNMSDAIFLIREAAEQTATTVPTTSTMLSNQVTTTRLSLVSNSQTGVIAGVSSAALVAVIVVVVVAVLAIRKRKSVLVMAVPACEEKRAARPTTMRSPARRKPRRRSPSSRVKAKLRQRARRGKRTDSKRRDDAHVDAKTNAATTKKAADLHAQGSKVQDSQSIPWQPVIAPSSTMLSPRTYSDIDAVAKAVDELSLSVVSPKLQRKIERKRRKSVSSSNNTSSGVAAQGSNQGGNTKMRVSSRLQKKIERRRKRLAPKLKPIDTPT